MMNLFDIEPVEGKLLNNIRNIVKNKLNKKVVSGIKICRRNKVKTCKIIIENDDPLRLDIKYPKNITRLQMIANKTDIEIPKVVLIEGQYKFSEWIEGVMIRDVWDVNEVLIKSGDLIARLNLIKDPVTNHFLTNDEFSGTNAIWTKDKKVYIVDHGRMKAELNPDNSLIKLLLKRIVGGRKNINLFLEGYSKHRSIDNIMKLLEEKNWKWPSRVKPMKV